MSSVRRSSLPLLVLLLLWVPAVVSSQQAVSITSETQVPFNITSSSVSSSSSSSKDSTSLPSPVTATAPPLINQHALLQVHVSVHCRIVPQWDDDKKHPPSVHTAAASVPVRSALDHNKTWYVTVDPLYDNDDSNDSNKQHSSSIKHTKETLRLDWSSDGNVASLYHGHGTLSLLLPFHQVEATTERTVLVALVEETSHPHNRIITRRLANLPRLHTSTQRGNPVRSVHLVGTTTFVSTRQHKGSPSGRFVRTKSAATLIVGLVTLLALVLRRRASPPQVPAAVVNPPLSSSTSSPASSSSSSNPEDLNCNEEEEEDSDDEDFVDSPPQLHRRLVDPHRLAAERVSPNHKTTTTTRMRRLDMTATSHHWSQGEGNGANHSTQGSLLLSSSHPFVAQQEPQEPSFLLPASSKLRPTDDPVGVVVHKKNSPILLIDSEDDDDSIMDDPSLQAAAAATCAPTHPPSRASTCRLPKDDGTLGGAKTRTTTRPANDHNKEHLQETSPPSEWTACSQLQQDEEYPTIVKKEQELLLSAQALEKDKSSLLGSPPVERAEEALAAIQECGNSARRLEDEGDRRPVKSWRPGSRVQALETAKGLEWNCLGPANPSFPVESTTKAFQATRTATATDYPEEAKGEEEESLGIACDADSECALPPPEGGSEEESRHWSCNTDSYCSKSTVPLDSVVNRDLLNCENEVRGQPAAGVDMPAATDVAAAVQTSIVVHEDTIAHVPNADASPPQEHLLQPNLGQSSTYEQDSPQDPSVSEYGGDLMRQEELGTDFSYVSTLPPDSDASASGSGDGNGVPEDDGSRQLRLDSHKASISESTEMNPGVSKDIASITTESTNKKARRPFKSRQIIDRPSAPPQVAAPDAPPKQLPNSVGKQMGSQVYTASVRKLLTSAGIRSTTFGPRRSRRVSGKVPRQPLASVANSVEVVNRKPTVGHLPSATATTASSILPDVVPSYSLLSFSQKIAEPAWQFNPSTTTTSSRMPSSRKRKKARRSGDRPPLVIEISDEPTHAPKHKKARASSLSGERAGKGKAIAVNK